MGLSSVFDIAATGMNAQSVRINTIASNLSNAQSASNSPETAYRAKVPVFQPLGNDSAFGAGGQGVKITEIVEQNTPLQPQYQPYHPQADEKGYVWYSNVNAAEEMTNMVAASRNYQTQIELMTAAKTMLQRTLMLGQ